IAHAGFILAGVIAATPSGISSVLFYLAAYSFVTIGAFAVVTLVRDAGGEATHLSRWAGLGRRSPLVAAAGEAGGQRDAGEGPQGHREHRRDQRGASAQARPAGQVGRLAARVPHQRAHGAGADRPAGVGRQDD
ncbi:proton-conducting transporter membrane subunit, partial [Streptomyces sp. E2N171]|uniref:proton-conducting transporter transmembrane domain-containing protein n=1 Tax=Streptomyces sp. E2N171 TaxID=1851914 RepID=UPI00237C320D